MTRHFSRSRARHCPISCGRQPHYYYHPSSAPPLGAAPSPLHSSVRTALPLPHPNTHDSFRRIKEETLARTTLYKYNIKTFKNGYLRYESDFIIYRAYSNRRTHNHNTFKITSKVKAVYKTSRMFYTLIANISHKYSIN